MKVKTLLIVVAILTILAGMTVPNLAGQQQRASRLLPAAIQLAEAEEQHILYMREEEKLSRDVYLTLYELWGAEVFANISESEQRHMDAVKNLITRYGLVDPVVDDTVGAFSNPNFVVLYDELVAAGEGSLEEALKAGVRIEELDIADLEIALQETSMRTVQRVFQNLLNGSYNHLNAFERNITAGGMECPVQNGQGGAVCPADQKGNVMFRGNRRSYNGYGVGNGGPGAGRCGSTLQAGQVRIDRI